MLVAFDAADHEEARSDQTSKEEENVENQRGVNAVANSPDACGLVHLKRRETRRNTPINANQTANKADHKNRNPAAKPLLIIARFHEKHCVLTAIKFSRSERHSVRNQ